jgi:medium-chain acyl-[acyl-carrier-protein] hydrolase
MTYSCNCLDVFRPNANAFLRLFCFPYAGGSSGIFRGWQAELPPFVEVIGVQPPGHAKRIKEPPFGSIQPLVDSLVPSIRRMAGAGHFDLFGHSMGAVVAFEVARKLKQRFGLSPTTLFVSGRQAPHLPERSAPTHHLPDAEFIEELRRMNGTPAELFANAEVMELRLASIRADFAAIQTYEYSPSDPLNCAICAIGGVDDESVTEDEIEAWRVHTSGGFRKIMLPGDHFFLNSHQNRLLKCISEEQKRRFGVGALWSERSRRSSEPTALG